MKKIIATALLLTSLGAVFASAADARHYRHRVCTMHHHHRVCGWR